MEENNEEVGGLNDYLGPQKLTPEIANTTKLAFECIGMNHKKFPDQSSPVLQLELQREDCLYYFNLNKTNLDALGEFMVKFDFKKLTEFIQCGFFFDKAKVTNPATGKMQDSLFISDITNE